MRIRKEVTKHMHKLHEKVHAFDVKSAKHQRYRWWHDGGLVLVGWVLWRQSNVFLQTTLSIEL